MITHLPYDQDLPTIWIYTSSGATVHIMPQSHCAESTAE